MRRSESEIRTQFTVDGGGDFIRDAMANAYQAGEAKDRRFHHGNEATCLIAALGRAGLEIVPKASGKGWKEVEAQAQAERQRDEDLGLTPPHGSAARVGEARRTGDWSQVSDADWTAWVNVLRRSDPAAAAEFLPPYETLDRLGYLFVQADGTVTLRGKPNIEVSVNSVVERDIEPAEDAPGYLKAVRLLRGALPSSKEIDVALGGASPDGSQGNVWALRQDIVDRRPPARKFWGEIEAAPFEPAAEPKVKAGQVVVLDEAGERKLQYLLCGKSVPTGRLVEVTYKMPDDSIRTQRHTEFGKLDAVSYEPALAGAEVEGATVLCARATLKLQPGKPAAASAGVFDRDVPPLGIFWSDGLISFAGDAAEMTAFRDMAARVVGVPGSRDAA
jgi:hypothetical protein